MIEIKVEGIDVTIADLMRTPRKVDLANVRSINRGLSSARTLMGRLIAADTGLRVTDVRNALPIQEATVGRQIGRLWASLKRIPLIRFKARGPEPSRGKGTGVRYALGRGRGHAPHAFIATVGTGRHRGVFMRKGNKRLPIRELHGPSLGRVFAKFRPQGLARAQEVFEQTFDHEMKFRAMRDAGTD